MSFPILPPARARARVAAMLAVVALTLGACGDGANPGAPRIGDPRYELTVKASTDDAVLMVRTPAAPAGQRGGTTLQVDVALRTKSGRTLPTAAERQVIDWTSLDPAVVTVDSVGLLTALGEGRTQVIVAHRQDGWRDTVQVAVIPVPVAEVVVAGPDSVGVDDSTSYAATPLDSAGEELLLRTVRWSSGAPAVASVSSAGEMIALAPGRAEVEATVDGVTGERHVTVTVQPVASVTVTPSTASLPQFRRTGFTAVAHDRRGKPLVDRAITWKSDAPATLSVNAKGDTAKALDIGAATVSATSEGKTGTAQVTVTNPVEARALWVTRFEYTGPSSVDFAKIATIFQKAALANFNVVYFQVRTSGDALYFSDLEPCSPRMCGTLGGPRPSRDPLAVALAEAAKYGIEVHAWLNAYTGFISGGSTACNQFINSTPANWLKANPNWSVSTKNFATGVLTRQVDNCLGTSEYMWVSPGVPEVRAQLARVSADIAARYGPLGLKGIHLDRIRYPSNQVSYDPATQEAFKAATGAYPASNAQTTWLDFRRGLVNQGVKDVYEAVRAVNPGMIISAAVFPGYKPRTGWAAQWSFTDLFQDPQAWAQGGYLDVEVPMNYPATATSTSWTVKAYCSNTDWTCVMDDHIERIEKQAGRQVYVGVGAIKGWQETKRQIDLAHDRLITGVAVYSYSQVDAIPNGWALLAAGPFKNKAIIPTMSWK